MVAPWHFVHTVVQGLQQLLPGYTFYTRDAPEAANIENFKTMFPPCVIYPAVSTISNDARLINFQPSIRLLKLDNTEASIVRSNSASIDTTFGCAGNKAGKSGDYA